MSPVAAAAPAFIWVARPGLVKTTWTPKDFAISGVPSLLPPSATIISTFMAVWAIEMTWLIVGASFKTGMTIEIFKLGASGHIQN
jgi:hypothetical protein